jgi:acyl-CoA synthetase (AMP-forming)/AMP-acid ligase II
MSAAIFDLAAKGLVATSTRPPIPGGPQTVAAVLERALGATPDAEALVGRDARYTYKELDSAANRAAHAFAALGVRAGDRVAASLPNHAEIVVAFLGAMRLGAIWVGINRPLAPPEKLFMLRDAEVALFLGDADTAPQIERLRSELPDLRQLLRGGPGGEWAQRLARADDAALRIEIDPFAPAAIAYTGGTTGFPKGAVHTQHNLLLPGAVARITGSYGPEERQGVLLPLTILNLMVLVPLLAFQVGSACIAMDRIDPLGVATWVREERIATFHAVPAILHDLLTHPDVKPAELASLTRPEVGGADCPDAFRNLYRERFGQDVSIGYGMTEAPTAVTRAEPGAPALPGICGRALPQVEIEIRAEDGRVLPTGEVGEICVAPARNGPVAGVYTPMLGYWKKDEETRAALRDGVLHTGDLGLLDESGTLFIRGRIKELILRGGANVYPAEVERVLHGDSRVAACAVLGRPDARLGERVVAFVQLAPGATLAAEELLARCRLELARYKVPEEVHFVESLPRTPMGKIRKPDLRALLGSGVA